MSEEQNGRLQAIDRITELIAVVGMNHREFAENIGLSNSTLASASNNQKGITEAVIVAVKKKYPAINLNWLIAGEGDMWNDGTVSETSKVGVRIAAANHEIALLKIQLEAAQAKNDLQAKQLEMLQNSLQDKEIIIELLRKTSEK